VCDEMAEREEGGLRGLMGRGRGDGEALGPSCRSCFFGVRFLPFFGCSASFWR